MVTILKMLNPGDAISITKFNNNPLHKVYMQEEKNKLLDN